MLRAMQAAIVVGAVLVGACARTNALGRPTIRPGSNTAIPRASGGAALANAIACAVTDTNRRKDAVSAPKTCLLSAVPDTARPTAVVPPARRP